MRFNAQRTVALATAIIGLSSLVSAAQADVVRYDLHNHPGGGALPYGLRLDELFDATQEHDSFSFDFDAPTSSMQMDVDVAGGTIRMYGVSVGGRHDGSSYASDQYHAQYAIDMFYQVGVQQLPGSDDVQVSALNYSNWGTIFRVGDVTGALALTDFHGDGPFSLELNEQSGNPAQSIFAGLGSLNHGTDPTRHTSASEWNFIATEHVVPTPGAAALAMLGMGMLGANRKRRN